MRVELAEVLWNCASHQFRYGSELKDPREPLRLTASTPPVDVTEDQLQRALEPLKDWPATYAQWRQLRWSVEMLSIDQLGEVRSVIHGTVIQGHIKDLVGEWKNYLLRAPQDATGHAQMLQELRAHGRFSHSIVVRELM